MINEDIRTGRKANGLTQERLAELMAVDVTTVQRWESGATEPSIAALQRLKNLFERRSGLAHPLFDIFLNLDFAAAVLDENCVYQKANRRFLNHFGAQGIDDIVGLYCSEVSEIWDLDVKKLTGLDPEELLFGDFTSVSIPEKYKVGQNQASCEHTIIAVRQVDFSGVLLHQIEQVF